MASLKEKLIKPINIKFPLRKSSAGAFEVNKTTVDAFADDLIILLNTNHGERIMNYNFGANLRSLLFEPDIDIEQKCIDRISTAIERWMPFITIKEISVTTNRTDPSVEVGAVKIKVHFFVGQTELDKDVTVTVRA